MENAELKEFVIRHIKQLKGDDTHRARCAFTGFTPREMQEEHGHSGKTRQQILDEYVAYDQKIDMIVDILKVKL
jgi:hypothetical protein